MINLTSKDIALIAYYFEINDVNSMRRMVQQIYIDFKQRKITNIDIYYTCDDVFNELTNLRENFDLCKQYYSELVNKLPNDSLDINGSLLDFALDSMADKILHPNKSR